MPLSSHVIFVNCCCTDSFACLFSFIFLFFFFFFLLFQKVSDQVGLLFLSEPSVFNSFSFSPSLFFSFFFLSMSMQARHEQLDQARLLVDHLRSQAEIDRTKVSVSTQA